MANNSANGAGGADEDIDRCAIFADGERMEAAVLDALRDVRILHKKMGVPLVGTVRGKSVSIPPEEIQIDLPAEKPARSPGTKSE